MKDKLALDYEPDMMADVNPYDGTWARVGPANGQPNGTQGGALQIEIPDKSYNMSNVQPFPINGIQ
ncbi:MAG: hypothetical protein U0872_12720 [Planctomycetaceae bacterium]